MEREKSKTGFLKNRFSKLVFRSLFCKSKQRSLAACAKVLQALYKRYVRKMCNPSQMYVVEACNAIFTVTQYLACFLALHIHHVPRNGMPKKCEASHILKARKQLGINSCLPNQHGKYIIMCTSRVFLLYVHESEIKGCYGCKKENEI